MAYIVNVAGYAPLAFPKQGVVRVGGFSERLLALLPLLGVPVRRILRLEAELAKLVSYHDSYRSLEQAFIALLHTTAPTLAGLKSIIAYRSGLEVDASYTALKHRLQPGKVPKITDKTLLDAALSPPRPSCPCSSIPATATPTQICAGPTRCTCGLSSRNPASKP